ncbi:MAG: thiamine pyrophosphate-dependent dehydrogenase E1 component subunit alpha [Deltaproteobacteria bacterium]|nr:thiamine pyrophosphate-dependent dehydrogenase E1 component subunit alpha [Deltaproteobacteria bacterium]
MEISREILIGMYSKMLLLRRFDEKVVELYRSGMKGLYHLTAGGEAVAVGVCSALSQDDYILSTHRGKGHYLAKGGDLQAILAEFMEKQTGCNRGKGGPMHIIDPSVGMLGANGIVGSSLPIACGAALSAKLRRSGQVAAAFFGDGAANSGVWHECMNLAGIWKLPVIFVCENNFYQESVPVSRHSSIQDLYARAAGYNIPGYGIDGMDVSAVYEAAVEAVQRAKRGDGATMLECKTYRFHGHSEADPTKGLRYRSGEELAAWLEKCPLKQAKARLLERGWIADAELEAIDQRCTQGIEEAVNFAKSSPDVPAEWALKDVFTDDQGEICHEGC